MKSFTLIALIPLLTGVSAQIDAEDRFVSFITQHSAEIATNSQWIAYIETLSISTPSALASFLSKWETVTDLARITEAASEYPTSAYFDLLTQLYPTTLLNEIFTDAGSLATVESSAESGSASATGCLLLQLSLLQLQLSLPLI